MLVGDVAGAVADARELWRQRGYDPYVIADEMFWRVTVDRRPAAFTTTPQASRIRLFDAITAYNPYESSELSHAGYGADSRFIPDVNDLYQRYRDATGGDVPIVPDVLPGYNDRGVRPSLDHYVIPRRWAPGAEEGSFLAEMLRQVADRWIDPRVPMVLVTSWNEWNEDSGIEPLREAAPTTADTATDGISRTRRLRLRGLRDSVPRGAPRPLRGHRRERSRRRARHARGVTAWSWPRTWPTVPAATRCRVRRSARRR